MRLALPAIAAVLLFVPDVALSQSAQSAQAAPLGAATSPGARARPDEAEIRARPLLAPAVLMPLQVPGFRDAVVSLPIGATDPRPVFIAAHGNYDRPDDFGQCGVWRTIVDDRAFVLCPRGVPRRDSPPPPDIRYTYDTGRALRDEIHAALAALRERYGPWVDDGPMYYTGFSLGAIMGVPILAAEPKRFPRAVLIEGGHDGWTIDRARAFARGGGQRILFACGQSACVEESRGAAAILKRAGIEVRIVSAPRMGHSYGGRVADEVRDAFDWVIDADARF